MATAKKKTSTAMMRWDEELAKAAVDAARTEANQALGQFLSVRGGQLTFNGAPIKGNTFDAVVVDHVIEYAYFDGDFDPDVSRSPVCFAFGRDEKEMAPHADVTHRQNDTCAGCSMNVFGSANKGRGKACKNVRRLALLHVDTLDGDIAKAGVVYLKLPVTSVKGWAAYVMQLANVMKRPPWAVVSRIAVEPDPKTQFKVAFEYSDKVTDGKILQALRDKNAATAQVIDFPYQPNDEAAAKPARRGAGGKKTAAAPARRRKY